MNTLKIKYINSFVEVPAYFQLIVMKELRKNVKKIKPVAVKFIRQDLDKYRAYQRAYHNKYYHTRIKPLR